jgi:chemotaxis protein MotB
MVVGHTDSQPVSNPATVKAGHLDNWYLSAHRAIAVSTELQKDRVGPQRLGVVGYADQRPVASNTTSSGQAQNRRVEVLILPTTIRGGAGVANDNGKTTSPKKSLNKDTSVQTDQRPVLNK